MMWRVNDDNNQRAGDRAGVLDRGTGPVLAIHTI